MVFLGNEKCADCGSPDPQWASINLGITLCIECSGVHRSLGVHITKVRSITLDAWEPEILKVMAELGNSVVNQIYESEVHEVVAIRANALSSDAERENWIKSKYIAKAFVKGNVLASAKWRQTQGRWTVRRLRRRNRLVKRQSSKEERDKEEKDEDTSNERRVNAEVILFGGTLGKHHVANIELDSDQESTDGEGDEEAKKTKESADDDLAPLTPNHLLFRAARVHNLPVMAQALALGADRDWRLRPSSSNDNNANSECAVVHQSIASGSVMACEYLLLNGAKINAADGDGNTPLHLAAKSGSTGQVCLLLKHRADHHARNKQGLKALDIAVQNSDADIVTLLRLADLNEEIRESGGADLGRGDDTFNDVVAEFSQMVYTHPKRLHKK